MLATVLVGALRNGRRTGHDLQQQAVTASMALADYASHSEFVTGQLVSIDLHTRDAVMVNAGHVWPLRLRRGSGRVGRPRGRPALRNRA